MQFSPKKTAKFSCNKVAIGKMKGETGGVTVDEFVRLMPNMYSLLVGDNSKYKKAKGVKNLWRQ